MVILLSIFRGFLLNFSLLSPHLDALKKGERKKQKANTPGGRCGIRTLDLLYFDLFYTIYKLNFTSMSEALELLHFVGKGFGVSVKRAQ